MKVTIKLYATLRDLLPPRAWMTGVEVDVPKGATAHQVIDQFRVPRKMAHLVLQNGVYLEPEQRDQPVIRDGDVVAVWPPIAGG